MDYEPQSLGYAEIPEEYFALRIEGAYVSFPKSAASFDGLGEQLFAVAYKMLDIAKEKWSQDTHEKRPQEEP